VHRDQRPDPRKATAASVAELRRLVDSLDASTLIGARDRAVILLGFAGMLRRSEVAALAVADVDGSPEGLQDLGGEGHRLDGPSSCRRRVVELRAAGLSMAAVPEALTAEGIPTARGGRWAAATVYAVLRSVALDGEDAA
jgi:integrase